MTQNSAKLNSQFLAGGDLSGTSSSQQVIKITGSAGSTAIAVTGQHIEFDGYAITPWLKQLDNPDVGAIGNTLSILAQTTPNLLSTGGNLRLAAGAGTQDHGHIKFGVGTFDVIDLKLDYVGAAEISAVPAVTSFTISQATSTISGTGAPLTIQAQNNTGLTSTGGSLYLKSGTGTSLDGYIYIDIGATNKVEISPAETYFVNDVFGIDAKTAVIQTTTSNSEYGYIYASDNVSNAETGCFIADLANRRGGAYSRITPTNMLAALSVADVGNGEAFCGVSLDSTFGYTAQINTEIATLRIRNEDPAVVQNVTGYGNAAKFQFENQLVGANIVMVNNGSTNTANTQNGSGIVYIGNALLNPHGSINPIAGALLYSDAGNSNRLTIKYPDGAYVVLNGATQRNVQIKTANYLITGSDDVVGVGTRASVLTITLPASPVLNQCFTVKDVVGTASTYNVIVSGNGNNIDGFPTQTISSDYASIQVIYNGTGWSIL